MTKVQTLTLPDVESPVDIDTDGITVTGITPVYEHTATDNELTRVASFGMTSTETAPKFGLEFHSPDGSNVLPNGGFEDTSASFVGWTKTTETGGAWSEQTTIVHGGLQAAKWDPSADANNGVITYARQPVIALNGYLLSGYAYFETSISQLNIRQVNVYWYDAESGGNLIGSDAFQWDVTTADTWYYQECFTTCPSGATYAEVDVAFSHNGSAGGQGNCYVDDVSLVEIDIDRGIDLRPDPTVRKGRWQFPNITTLNYADDDHLALFARNHRPYIVSDNGQFMHFGGKAIVRTRISNSAAKTTIHTETVRANSIGRQGTKFIVIQYIVFNNTGVNRTATLDIDLGGSNLFTAQIGGNINPSATNNYPGFILISIANNNLENSQLGTIWFNRAGAATGTFANITDQQVGWFTSAIDTTIDNTLTISATLSFASTSYLWTSWGWTRGPHTIG